MDDETFMSAHCLPTQIDHQILGMAEKTPPLSLDLEAIGKRLQELREAHEKSQEDVAYAIGGAASSLSRWERGLVKPSPDQLLNLAHYFGTTVDYILIGKQGAAMGVETEALREFKKTDLGKTAEQRGWLAELRRINPPAGMEAEIYRQVVFRLLDLRPQKKRSSE